MIINFTFGNDGRSPNKNSKAYSECKMERSSESSFEVYGQSCKFHNVNTFEVG